MQAAVVSPGAVMQRSSAFSRRAGRQSSRPARKATSSAGLCTTMSGIATGPPLCVQAGGYHTVQFVLFGLILGSWH